MAKTDLTIVILNYNSIDFLDEALASIQKSDLSGIRTNTIVVDNASSDDSVERIKKNYKWVKLIASNKNKGFAGGNNLARRKVESEYVLFLNPDVVLEKDTLKKVYDYMEKNSTVGAATCRLELVDGSLDDSTHRGFPTPINAFFHFSGISKFFPKSRIFSGYQYGWKMDSKKPHEVDAISGAFFFVRKKVADMVNWWDEDYFWYGEDIEFCYRIKQEGLKIMFLPNIKAMHYKGVTSGIKKHSKNISKASKKTRIRSAKASTKAMRIFYKKHYLTRYPRFVSFFVLFSIDILEKFRIWKVS
jgi:GT2 family glycosyltransferase